MNNLTTANNAQTSVQISKLRDVLAGDHIFDQPALLKNLTADNITIQVLLSDNTEYISTVLYPGWNVEIVSAIKGAAANQIQYGN